MADDANAQPTLNQRVAGIIEKIRPMIQADGGDIELVNIDEPTGKVSIRFQGACKSCPMSAMTLKMGVEKHVKEAVPEVSEVIAVD